jgi:cytochrome P450
MVGEMQAFTPAAIASYTPAIYSAVNGTLEEWAEKGSVKAWEGCRDLAFDVAAVVLLGKQLDPLAARKLFAPPLFLGPGLFCLSQFSFTIFLRLAGVFHSGASVPVASLSVPR